MNENENREMLKPVEGLLDSGKKSLKSGAVSFLRKIKDPKRWKKYFKHIRIALYILLFFFVFSLMHSQKIGLAEVDEFIRNVDFDVYLGIVVFLILVSLIIDLMVWMSTVKSLRKYEFLQSFKFKYAGAFFIFVIMASVLILFFAYVKKHPQYSYTHPNDGEMLLDYTKPIEVKFNVPVRVDKLKPSITPAIKGEWEWEPYLGIDSLTRVGKFHIEETPFPSERFVGYVAGINKISDGNEHEYGFIFYSPDTPKIRSSYPQNGQENVLKDSNFTITFDRSYDQLVEVEAKIEPKVDFEVVKEDERELSLILGQTLAQDAAYKLTLTYKPKSILLDTGEIVSISDQRIVEVINFRTTKQPSVESFSPTGGSVRSDEKISITFVEAMDRKSVEESFSLEPEVDGRFVWQDDLTFTYETDEPLPLDTQFKVMILQGTKSANGGSLESNIEYEFKTLGKVWVTGFTPESGISNVNEYTEIVVHFDQEVDHEDAQSRFAMNPATAGVFRWEENNMIFKPNAPLGLDTLYSVDVAKGVKSIHGKDSESDFHSEFRVRSDSYAFNIPIYYQQTNFSCNIYTAIMILAWKGIGANATGLISEIGYNTNQSGGNWTGNPYSEYIGNADGSYGYGVYWPPIQQILARRGVNSEVRQNWNVSELTQTVQQGRPVIVWRYNGVGGGQNISWTASDGTYVNAFNGMHGSIVTGFTGPATNPTAIYIHDPWLGRLWLDTATFDAYWSYSGRVGLIVY